MNNISLIGRLTRDPEVETTRNNKVKAKFTLAVDRGISKAEKEKGYQATDFIPCEVYGSVAETVSMYAKKGLQIGVEGKMQIDQWKNNQGENVSYAKVLVSRIQLLQYSNNQNNQNNGGNYYNNVNTQRSSYNGLNQYNIANNDSFNLDNEVNFD